MLSICFSKYVGEQLAATAARSVATESPSASCLNFIVLPYVSLWLTEESSMLFMVQEKTLSVHGGQ